VRLLLLDRGRIVEQLHASSASRHRLAPIQITIPGDSPLLMTAPVLYRGPWNEKKVKACFSGRSAYGGAQEGYVVRRSEAFLEADFQTFGRQICAPQPRADRSALDAETRRQEPVGVAG
jgi:hypothetical protein